MGFFSSQEQWGAVGQVGQVGGVASVVEKS